MNNFLAKSNPKETIQEHTNKLIDNYLKLKKIYPDLNVNWDILYLACLYHDLGKMNIKFQEKVSRNKTHEHEIPHGILSLAFINSKKLKKVYSNDEIKILAHAVGYHHERDFKVDSEALKSEIEMLEKEVKEFKYDKIEDIQVKKLSDKYFSFDRIDETENLKLFLEYTMVKGLLNRLDYAASGGIPVEEKNDLLLKKLDENLLEDFKKDDPEATWNELQIFMKQHSEENVVTVAQTGMGKTEAALLWIGDNKGFFTLPLRTAINAIYERIRGKVVVNDYADKVGLLHSDILKEYLNTKDEDIDIFEYYDKTRQLSLPLTICTIDQIFDFVYRYRGFESKLATLSYSKVVIDEVQMYSPDLLAYLIVGLSYIDKVGGKFAILTATLPRIFIDLLNKEGIKFLQPKPFTNDRIRHSMKIIEDKINSEFIKSKYDNNKVLVICNTVKEAQKIYLELKCEIKEVNLFHSGFTKKDRKEKEKNILTFGDKNTVDKGIWVATSAVEASLDIDFDVLVTELSDLNGLFQRFGRCYRNRDWKSEGYNCYVFDGGDKKCSGVGSVIDKKIFELSKNILREQYVIGPIYESQKISLIDNLYTTDNLKDSDYYKELIDVIKYLKKLESFEKSKQEVKKRFRNIYSTTIIPKTIYDENTTLIENSKETINKKYNKTMNKIEVDELKKSKLRAKNSIDDLTISIRSTSIVKDYIETYKITNYLILNIYDCDYCIESGIKHKEKNYRINNAEERMT